MFKILIGIVIGIAISTVGFSGITRMLDRGVESVKTVVSEQAK